VSGVWCPRGRDDASDTLVDATLPLGVGHGEYLNGASGIHATQEVIGVGGELKSFNLINTCENMNDFKSV
jgi:hypothetical protein